MVKSLSKFGCGKKIVQVGDSAVKLEDGKWWNKDKISLTKTVIVEDVNSGKRCVGFLVLCFVPRAVEPECAESWNGMLGVGVCLGNRVGGWYRGRLKEDGGIEAVVFFLTE
ncbi:hypothetical protein NDU88_003241 [Pleurodeles waltl]|uniref:Uncharacterized protein n=1 Tax=Pleurodeles waltl TaxID=8319 RepID=A0AAV7REA3_PLEWA|nr:hypothetical protein NDU88_003241 [Pleurodeles waltl]